MARADDRAANGDALENDVEDWRRESAGRKPDKRDRSFSANDAQRLREGRRRHGRDQHAVRAPAGGLHDFSRRLEGSRVNGHIGPRRFGECKLVRRDVERRHMKPIAFAYWIARCPRPPTPEIATHSPGLASVSFSPLYVVTPAHRIGAWPRNSQSSA